MTSRHNTCLIHDRNLQLQLHWFHVSFQIDLFLSKNQVSLQRLLRDWGLLRVVGFFSVSATVAFIQLPRNANSSKVRWTRLVPEKQLLLPFTSLLLVLF